MATTIIPSLPFLTTPSTTILLFFKPFFLFFKEQEEEEDGSNGNMSNSSHDDGDDHGDHDRRENDDDDDDDGKDRRRPTSSQSRNRSLNRNRNSSNDGPTTIDKQTLNEISRGMMLASLAITDNEEQTLAKVGKANPWHIQALTMITGSEERAHRPLKDILTDDMDGLVLDTLIDVSGITKGGHFLDTQGYIAHNDDVVVVSFRCTTSAFDWMTNFNSTSSVWEVEEDLKQGFSGFCSGYEGLCCIDGGQHRPRVHTGFYNNFLASWPIIEQYVGPYLSVDNQRQRTLYVVGHSLGAGIANLTASHFLLRYNWKELPQNLVLVTAGSPRSICKSMKDIIDEELDRYGPDNVRFHRIVKGRDVVTTVPPKFFGFDHMTSTKIVIQDDGDIVFKQKQQPKNNDDDDGDDDTQNDDEQHEKRMMLETAKSVKQFSVLKQKQQDDHGKVDGRDDIDNNDDDNDDDDDASPTCHDDSFSDSDPDSAEDDNNIKKDTKYDRFVSRIPQPLRDHMPDFYLKPMLKAQGIKHGSSRPVPVATTNVPIETNGDEDGKDKATIMSTGNGSKSSGDKSKHMKGPSSSSSSSSTTKKWIPRVFRRRTKVTI